jgi:hypothetical protein
MDHNCQGGCYERCRERGTPIHCWYSHFGKQYGSYSKSYSREYIQRNQINLLKRYLCSHDHSSTLQKTHPSPSARNGQRNDDTNLFFMHLEEHLG